MTCPRCGQRADVEVDLYFGDVTLDHYRLGDTYRWRPRKQVKNGGRPEGGDLDGEGYAECPLCGKDFFVIVRVRGDVLEGVTVDADRPGYVPD
jgi:hypothetical protein